MPVEVLEHAGELPDSLPLWRYIKLSTLFLLLKGTSFFPSVATLRAADPLEGDLHPAAPSLNSALSKIHGQPGVNELETWLLETAEEWIRNYHNLNKNNAQFNTELFADLYQRQLAKRRAVWCWFSSDIESAGMWSVYGHGGVAVGTTVGALKNALPDNRHFQLSRIRYADRRVSSPHRFSPRRKKDAPYIHRPHFIKGREYMHEQEVRVATFCHGQEKGATIRKIAAGRLVREIILSPIWPHGEAKAVAEILRKQDWPSPPRIRMSSLLGSAPEDNEVNERFDSFFDDLGEYTEEGVPQLIREL
jgi:hypothetical protein